MCSYNRVNNTYGCENSVLLDNILRGELGFQGFVVSDWGAQHSGLKSANAGLEMAMPDSTFWKGQLVASVSNDTFAQARLDEMATR
jgi:beta-glucosidase